MCAGFAGKLRLEYEGCAMFLVQQQHQEAFHYVSKAGAIYTPRHGCRINGASIPRILCLLFPRFGSKNPRLDYFKSAVLHDYFYGSKIVSRELADELFYESMLEDGVNPLVAWLFFRSVSLFGRRAWRKAK
jgi:hypothetical protein